jgi:hypothetical protein
MALSAPLLIRRGSPGKKWRDTCVRQMGRQAGSGELASCDNFAEGEITAQVLRPSIY